MNTMPENEIVVVDMAGAYARLILTRPELVPLMIRLGFVPSCDLFERPISGMEDRALIARTLIQMGALFAAGHGWCPAAVAAQLQRLGRITTGYREIAWLDSSEYRITEAQSR